MVRDNKTRQQKIAEQYGGLPQPKLRSMVGDNNKNSIEIIAT